MHTGEISDEMLCAGAAGKDACQANNLHQKIHQKILSGKQSSSNRLFLDLQKPSVISNLSFGMK